MTVANSIHGLYIMYFGRAADPAALEAAIPLLESGALTFEQYSNALAQSDEAKTANPYLEFPNQADPEIFIKALYQRSFNISNPDQEGVDFWVGLLEQGVDPGSVVAQFAAAIPPDSTEFTTLQNKADVAAAFTNGLIDDGITPTTAIMGNSSNFIAPVDDTDESVETALDDINNFIADLSGSSGNSFVFTPMIDNLVGTEGNDLFIGDNSGTDVTVQISDQVNGGGGLDTLRYFGADGTAPVNLPQATGVEIFEFAVLASDPAIDFSPLADSGLERVVFSNPTVDIVGTTGLSEDIALGVSNTNVNPISITGDFGTATEATFYVTNTSQANIVTLNGGAIETLNVVAGGSDNVIQQLTAGTSITDLIITGTGDLEIGATTPLDDSITTIDASENEGGVNLFVGSGQNVGFDGSSGDDRITFQAGDFVAGDDLDGGEGNDVLILNDADTEGMTDLLTAINAVDNFQTLGFAVGANVNVSEITAFTDYLFQGTPNTVTEATSEQTFVLEADNSTLDIGNALGEDEITVKLQGEELLVTSLDVDQNTTLTLESTLATDTPVGGGSSATTESHEVDLGSTRAIDNATILVTGDYDLNILGFTNVTTTGVTVDASELDASLIVTGSTLIDAITGSDNDDVIIGEGGADLLTGGEGEDVFSYFPNGAADSNAGVLSGAALTFDTITDFNVDDDTLAYANFSGTFTEISAGDADNLTQAATNALGDLAAANDFGAFGFDGDTYVLGSDGNADLTDGGDIFIQLEGELTLTASNFSTTDPLA